MGARLVLLVRAMPRKKRKGKVLHQVGQRLLDYRHDLRYTQQRVSIETGISQGHISKIEHGVNDLSVTELLAFARSYGTVAAELLKQPEAPLVYATIAGHQQPAAREAPDGGMHVSRG